MTSHSSGIQQLIAAEKRAADKIEEARKRKARRIRQAKEEGLGEIEKFKAECESKYKATEDRLIGSRGENEKVIAASGDKRVFDVAALASSNQEDVVKMLIESVLEINAEVHVNYRA